MQGKASSNCITESLKEVIDADLLESRSLDIHSSRTIPAAIAMCRWETVCCPSCGTIISRRISGTCVAKQEHARKRCFNSELWIVAFNSNDCEGCTAACERYRNTTDPRPKEILNLIE